ncbi:unnamed protein product [Cladocopium goreaui]|uniref:Uncharacterized protein n=1 Tax=Cladocopium goreaui TaxID=2562237 RepID=A0A9P1GAG3_9DINO|nr:unnamed protein product [Cladocopium goreaui]
MSFWRLLQDPCFTHCESKTGAFWPFVDGECKPFRLRLKLQYEKIREGSIMERPGDTCLCQVARRLPAASLVRYPAPFSLQTEDSIDCA